MVPVHIEQACNAHEAMLEGAGIKSDCFNMDELIAFSQLYTENTEFRTWENGAKMMIVARLEAAVEQYNNTATNKGYGLTRFGRKLVHPTFRVIRQSCSAYSLSLKYRSSLNPYALRFITFILLLIPSTLPVEIWQSYHASIPLL